MSPIVLLSVFVAVLVVILSRRQQMLKLLRGLLNDRKELTLLALFVLVEVGLVAALLAVFGPNIAGVIMLASIALFAIWALRPPAKRG